MQNHLRLFKMLVPLTVGCSGWITGTSGSTGLYSKTLNVWHKRYCYISYIKSEISDWRTGGWFLKPFKERVEKIHYLRPSKTKFYKKTRTV